MFTIFTGLLFMNCEGDSPVIYRYTVENQSGVPIQLQLFYQNNIGETSFRGEIHLDNGQKIEKKEKKYAPSFQYNFVDFFKTEKGKINKMNVIYNNQKKTMFIQQTYTSLAENTCEDIFGREVPCDPRNILNTFIYKNVNEHYIFTTEDYQQALDCKGNCE